MRLHEWEVRRDSVFDSPDVSGVHVQPLKERGNLLTYGPKYEDDNDAQDGIQYRVHDVK